MKGCFMKKRIKEVIVVEGKHDAATLKKYYDVDTIETSGLGIDKEVIERISVLNETRGVILFLDPDAPGEKIRNKVNSAIKGLKNAFIDKSKAKTSKKVGVEHASFEDLDEALSHLLTYEDGKDILSKEDYLALGLNGSTDAALKREYLGKLYHIGKCNAKTFYKRLNMLKIDKEKIANDLKGMGI